MTASSPPETPDHLGSGDENASRATAVPKGAWNRWRPLLLRWHFYAGLLVGPFLLIAAVTGLLYSLVPQIDRAVYSHELTVDDVGEQRLPLSQQVAAARAVHPEGTVSSIRPPEAPADTTRVVLAVDDVPESYGRTVFVDPYTGEVRGALTTFGQWMPLRAWFDEFHRTLHLGAFGRNYSELAASWLWFVAVAGLVLWIGHRRRTRKTRRLLIPDTDAPRRQRLLSWHGAIGIWVIIGLLALSASGLSWSRWTGANIADLRTAMSWTTPTASTSLSGEASDDGGHGGHGHGAASAAAADIDVSAVDGVYAAAGAAGLRDPLVITPATDADTAWSVRENKRNFPESYDAVTVDPTTDEIVDRVDYADWPFMAKATSTFIGLHMGIYFGLANQIALAALAIGLITMIVLGYLMWWRRRPTRSQRALATPPRRGALGELKPAEAVAVVAVVAVIGWYMPLFGLPLALFIAVDTVIGAFRSRDTDTRGTDRNDTDKRGMAKEVRA
ncbi:PepSY domain-containing protein [Gordonia sp. PKS22-38]|uniref:PepSY domain-containing protein n=1 Tax=Gordonia prachuapensis TaxID=3115651 RepID=A0ABU7MNP5_9ACTN|nr:PepSY domain-containing protein [Gordonia sp. PKS22-38]